MATNTGFSATLGDHRHRDALIEAARDVKRDIITFYNSRRLPQDVQTTASYSPSNKVGPGGNVFQSYRSFVEAVHDNPTYEPIDDLTVFCVLCQRSFKMSTKCNLRYVIRHEQSLKHCDKLSILLKPSGSAETKQMASAYAFTQMQNGSTKLPPCPFLAAKRRRNSVDNMDTELDRDSSNSYHHIHDNDGSNLNDNDEMDIISTRQKTIRGRSDSAPDAMLWGNDLRSKKSHLSLGKSMKLKKKHLEHMFKAQVEDNPLFEVLGPLTVHCKPCNKKIKLDRQRSPRTVLLHAEAQVHLAKLKKYYVQPNHKRNSEIGLQVLADASTLSSEYPPSETSRGDSPSYDLTERKDSLARLNSSNNLQAHQSIDSPSQQFHNINTLTYVAAMQPYQGTTTSSTTTSITTTASSLLPTISDQSRNSQRHSNDQRSLQDMRTLLRLPSLLGRRRGQSSPPLLANLNIYHHDLIIGAINSVANATEDDMSLPTRDTITQSANSSSSSSSRGTTLLNSNQQKMSLNFLLS